MTGIGRFICIAKFQKIIIVVVVVLHPVEQGPSSDPKVL